MFSLCLHFKQSLKLPILFSKHRRSPFWQNYGEHIFPYLLLQLFLFLPFWEYTQACWHITFISLHMNIIFYVTENVNNFIYCELLVESNEIKTRWKSQWNDVAHSKYCKSTTSGKILLSPQEVSYSLSNSTIGFIFTFIFWSNTRCILWHSNAEKALNFKLF